MFVQNISLRIFFIFAFVVFCTAAFIPAYTQAVSVMYSDTYGDSIESPSFSEIDDELTFSIELYDMQISVAYHAIVHRTDTGEIVPPGGSVPAGTELELVFQEHASSDIHWFGTGGAFDSPYGEWRTNAEPGDMQCLDKDYVSSGNSDNYDIDMHFPFVMHQPHKSIGGIPDLSCSGGEGTSGEVRCSYTPMDEGEITPLFNYQQTEGKFYVRLYLEDEEKGRSSDPNTELHQTCVGFNYPMATKDDAFDDLDDGIYYDHYEYILNVPQQQISYPITVTAVSNDGENDDSSNDDDTNSNTTPTTPNVTAGSGQCVTDEAFTLTVSGTDPDSDDIRYFIDWNADGSTDQFAPSSGYVSSGTEQSVSRTYSTEGDKTVQVRVQDEHGAVSPWTQFSFTCSIGDDGDDDAGGNGVGDGSTGSDGTGDGSTGSDGAGDGSTDGNGAGDGTGGDSNGPGSSSVDLTAIPSLVNQGDITQLHWSASGVESCEITGSNEDAFIGIESPQEGRGTSPITERTTYTLSCVDSNDATLTDTATVDILPLWVEL